MTGWVLEWRWVSILLHTVCTCPDLIRKSKITWPDNTEETQQCGIFPFYVKNVINCRLTTNCGNRSVSSYPLCRQLYLLSSANIQYVKTDRQPASTSRCKYLLRCITILHYTKITYHIVPFIRFALERVFYGLHSLVQSNSFTFYHPTLVRMIIEPQIPLLVKYDILGLI